jgi:ABC-type transport system involved in multi-copper enzyme maturation permease subunit
MSVTTVPLAAELAERTPVYHAGFRRVLAMELFKLRHRRLSLWMSVVLIGVVTLISLVGGLHARSVALWPLENFSPPLCSEVRSAREKVECVNAPASQAELTKYREKRIVWVSRTLRLPDSFGSLALTAAIMLGICGAIVGGVSAGGEYTDGTVRLLLTRGPARWQVAAGKAVAVLVFVTCAVVLCLGVGIGTGYAFNGLWGAPGSTEFFSGTWLGRAAGVAALVVFSGAVYGFVAMAAAILGQSGTAGVGLAIGWIAAQPILSQVLPLLGRKADGGFGGMLAGLPDWFPHNAVMTLLTTSLPVVSPGLAGRSNSPGDPVQATAVLAIWCVGALAISLIVLRRRDVTS